MKTLLALVLTSLFLSPAHAATEVLKDFDGLGENKELFDTAKALHPELSIRVVQDRVVDRRNRLEVAPELLMVTGGDAYTDTFGYGANIHYHIVPWVSVGARYTKYSNELNKEGQNLINDVDANGQGIIPDIDYAKQSYMGFVNVYPIYGKMNTMNIGITHFDVYATAGYGNIELRSGKTNTWTAGGGVGFWFSQHLSTRLEVRYQTYKALRYTGEDDINSVVGGLQLGYLL